MLMIESKMLYTGYKEKGTVYFKASRYTLALKLYKRGLGIIEKSSFTKDEEKEATKGVQIHSASKYCCLLPQT